MVFHKLSGGFSRNVYRTDQQNTKNDLEKISKDRAEGAMGGTPATASPARPATSTLIEMGNDAPPPNANQES